MTSTGDKAFVAFQGADYALSDNRFNQFKTAYEQAPKKSQDGQGTSFATLGIDPRKWLTDLRNAGQAKVGDADTIKITGGVDVAALLDDVNAALDKVAALGVSGAGACRTSSPSSSAGRCSTRSRIRPSRSTPARRTRSCAGCS